VRELERIITHDRGGGGQKDCEWVRSHERI
jgi:hypothetical protein